MTTPIGQLGEGGLSVPAKQKQQDQNTFSSAVKRSAGATPPGAMDSARSTTAGHGTSSNPMIYIGRSATASALGFGGIAEATAYAPQSEVQNMYYNWDNKTKNKFLSQLSLAGYDTGQLKDAQLANLWAGYVEVAGKYSLAGKWISPWEIIGKDIAQREEEVAKPRTVTQTQKSYSLSTAEDAHALFQGAAQTLLGRDPTKAEIARFKGILNKYEQANPSVTTTTSNYLGQELQKQESTTKGGVSAASQQLIATEEAKKDPEYGAYQAATNGMNWLMEMIGG